ncbi:MAG: ABC transporter substrate-binding protein [Burkholderiales bacterium]|nr:ABC transporter substrate-binding protein [Burkholderiales bacterium]
MDKHTERRLILKGIASAALVGAAPRALGQAAPAGKLTSIRSTARSWLWSPEDYAALTKLFDKSGLSVGLAATNRGVNQDALLSGAADILLGAPTQNMRVQIRKQPVKMICGFVNKYASNIVVKKTFADKAGVTEASPVAAKAAVLKGLRIGTTGPGAGPDQLTRYMMNIARINPDREAQLVPVQGGPAAMIAAFDKGQIDGFCLSSPTSDVAVSKFGGAYLFNMVNNPPPDLADYLYISASVTEKTMKEKPRELAAYCRGIALALRAIHGDRAAFRKWAREYFKDLDDDLFERAFANNAAMYMKTPVPTRPQFQRNVEFLDAELKLLNQPGVPGSFRFDDAWDLSFVEKGMAGL